MKRLLIVAIIPVLFIACNLGHSANHQKDRECIMQPRDAEIFGQVMKHLENDRDMETGDLVIKTALFFLETPYVANTLEIGDTEKLVINLRELDCTTFAENCLALAKTSQKKKPDFEYFIKELQKIRYRGGIINEYPSRLHYFSDWIYNNDQKKIVKSVSQEIAHTVVPNQVDYMTTHPDIYRAFEKNPAFKTEMAAYEGDISRRMTWFIPENKLAESEDQLRDGDIIGITTDIEGLDISHVVIAYRQEGRIRFIHASSKEMKVVISDETLVEYLVKSKLASGIMAARPL